jgi:hypothetical protein
MNTNTIVLTTDAINKKCFDRAGAISLILFPFILIIAFSMHFMGEFGLKDFFNFQLSYTQPPAERFMELFRSGNLLDFALPHLFVYLSLPLLIFSALYLGKYLFNKMPKLTITGITLTIIGTIYMGGIFGSWLSFMAIGNVSLEQVHGAIPALSAIIESKSILSMTGILAGFSLIGFLLISAGLFCYEIIPRWQSALIFVGNLMIIVFMDLDNLMLIGSVLWLVGAIPIVLDTFQGEKK